MEKLENLIDYWRVKLQSMRVYLTSSEATRIQLTIKFLELLRSTLEIPSNHIAGE